MESEDYKAALAALGYSRREWAKIVENVPRAVQNRADGTNAVPGAEALLLRLLMLRPELKELVRTLANGKSK